MDKKLLEYIDSTIKHIWEYEIKADYDNGLLLKEDTLKNALYYHIRTKLGNVLIQHGIRIYTEFDVDKFRGSGCRPDVVLVRIREDDEADYLGNCIEEYVCVIELKFKGDTYSAVDDIYKDYRKLEYYIKELNLNCPLYYMATIWERDDTATSWVRKNCAWAKGVLTELNASYDEDEMRFYISEHK